jgi:hypothetical protein
MLTLLTRLCSLSAATLAFLVVGLGVAGVCVGAGASDAVTNTLGTAAGVLAAHEAIVRVSALCRKGE